MTEVDHDAGAFEICGVRVDGLDLTAAADLLLERAVGAVPTRVHLCNAYVLALATRDRSYLGLLNRGDVNVADGAPVAWAGRRLGFPFVAGHPSGTELVLETVQRGVEFGVGHYLYGASDPVVRAMAESLERAAPGVQIVGIESPPFRALDDEEKDDVVRRLRSSGADIVWVGLGTPKQDAAVDWLADSLSAVVVPVGAAFDFLAGGKSRAPQWMRRLGLEWLHRLSSEPRRLWKRYLVGNLRFLRCALGSRRVLVPPGTPGRTGSGS